MLFLDLASDKHYQTDNYAVGDFNPDSLLADLCPTCGEVGELIANSLGMEQAIVRDCKDHGYYWYWA